MHVPDVIIRHPKEKLSKCSVEPLRKRPDLIFHNARPGFSFNADGYILLAVDAPPLTPQDRDLPLLLLDSTWRLLPQLIQAVSGTPLPRSLPQSFCTAYPRSSKISTDPSGGLATVEALYVARLLQGRPDSSLLQEYYWKDQFLLLNKDILSDL